MMKKAWICFVFLFLAGMWQAEAQRKLPVKSRGQKEMDKQTKKNERAARQSATELRWDPRELPNKSKGYPELSAWHTGTTGIIASDAAEISLFSPTRVGFSKRTELLFRIAFFTQCGTETPLVVRETVFFSQRAYILLSLAGIKNITTYRFQGFGSGFRKGGTGDCHASRIAVFLVNESPGVGMSESSGRKDSDFTGWCRVLCQL